MQKQGMRASWRKAGVRGHGTIAVVVLACWLAAGCAPARKQPKAVAAPAPGLSALKKQNQALEKALAAKREQVQNLEHDKAGLKIKILAYEALVQNLHRSSEIRQKRLDAAIVEVVRAKAKLRSLESKAEAASTLAEAEIAVKALKSRGLPADEIYEPEIAAIEQLLTMGAAEFKAQNYGGALFLANQTKEQVRVLQSRLDRNAKSVAVVGESPFVQPLPLKLLKKSNLRQAPGLDQKIVVTLDQGTRLVGYAFKGSWIRVETQDGVNGWVFQDLVGAP